MNIQTVFMRLKCRHGDSCTNSQWYRQ